MRYVIRLAGKDHSVEVVDTTNGRLVRDEHGSRAVSLSTALEAGLTGGDGSYRVLIDGRVVDLSLSGHGKNLEVVGLGTTQQVSIVSERDRRGVASGAQTSATRRAITAQMPGKVLHVRVQPEQQVHKGQALLVMEAMKMENELYAESDLRVLSVTVRAGDTVEMGAKLLIVES